MRDITIENWDNVTKKKLRYLVLKELENSDSPLNVTELTRRTIKNPTWDERDYVQEVLGDLLQQGKVAQTPKWGYVNSN